MCSLFSLGDPHFLNQEPPAPQQLRLPLLLLTHLAHALEGVAGLAVEIVETVVVALLVVVLTVVVVVVAVDPVIVVVRSVFTFVTAVAVGNSMHALIPSSHVCSFFWLGVPHFEAQAPPAPQQLRLPCLLMAHLAHALEGVAGLAVEIVGTAVVALIAPVLIVVISGNRGGADRTCSCENGSSCDIGCDSCECSCKLVSIGAQAIMYIA